MTPIRTRWTALFALLPLFALVACGGGDDGTGPGGSDDAGEQLTEQEVGEMMDALAAAGAFEPPSAGSGSAPPAGVAAAVPVELDVDNRYDCPAGGTVRVSGSMSGEVDQDTGAGSFQLTMTQTHEDCVADSQSGTRFKFNGAPSLDTDMDFDVTSAGDFTATGTHGGSLLWETDGRQGTCTVDLTYDVSGSGDSYSGSVSGTVCGVSFSESLDVG